MTFGNWTLTAALLSAAVLAAPATAKADLQFDADKPRVFSIQPRPYRLAHEFQLGIGVLPLDAFYTGVVGNFSYTYHFTDFWAWEIVSIDGSFNIDTSLRDDLKKEYGVEPVQGGGDRIKLFGTTSIVAKPLFGKLAFFNSDIVFSETFFTAGIGPLQKGDNWLLTIQVGAGLRFWAGDTLSIRFDVRDYVVFEGFVPVNNLFLALSTSFNLGEVSESAPEADSL